MTCHDMNVHVGQHKVGYRKITYNINLFRNFVVELCGAFSFMYAEQNSTKNMKKVS